MKKVLSACIALGMAFMLSACSGDAGYRGENSSAGNLISNDDFDTFYESDHLWNESQETDVSLQKPSGNTIASGTSNNVNWEIYENGLLVVTGFGDWDHKSNGYYGPWIKYWYDITAAEVHLTGTTNAHMMFDGCKKLTTIDLRDFDTSNVTDMGKMFEDCNNLKSLDLSNMDTGKVTNMTSMFENCHFLTNLDLSGFNTSNVTNMGRMFFECNSLKNIDVSNFNTGNVTNMGDMFYMCFSLESLDVSGFDTGNVAYLGKMFYNCQNLKELDVSKFDTSSSKDFQAPFAYCKSLKYLDLSLFNFSSNKIGNRDLLDHCTGLMEVKAPINFGDDKYYIPLPGTFYDVDTGMECTVIRAANAGHTLKRK